MSDARACLRFGPPGSSFCSATCHPVAEGHALFVGWWRAVNPSLLWAVGKLVVCACSCCWGWTPRVRRGSGALGLLPVFTEGLAAQRWRVCEAESACRSCCVTCVWVEGHQVLTCTAATRNPNLPILGNLKDFFALFQWREVMLQKPRVWLWCTLWLHNFLQNTYFHWLWS